MTVILDASALLALIFDEPGAEVVKTHARGSRILAVNFSEVLARVIDIDGDPERAQSAADRLEIEIVAFDRQLAAAAANLRKATAFMGASFADRACLAFGRECGLPILTSDRDWQRLALGLDIRMIR